MCIFARVDTCGTDFAKGEVKHMEMLKRFEPLALLLMFLGALNWGIVGITDGDTNVVSDLFGNGTFTDVLYVVIGVSGLYFVPRLLEAMHIAGPHPRVTH